MNTISRLWWLPIITVPIIAIVIFRIKRKLSGTTNSKKEEPLIIIGTLMLVAGSLFPIVLNQPTVINFPLVLFVITILFLIGYSVKLITPAKRK
jgi:hypothetical protein